MKADTRSSPSMPSAPATLFSEPQWQQVQQLLDKLDERQSLWLSGYLAAGQEGTALPSPPTAPVTTLTTTASQIVIAYGSETGNGQNLALKLAGQAATAGIQVEVKDLAELKVRQLAKVPYLLLICSTHGDGDPPEPAQDFYDALMADNAPQLNTLQFSVLALGDSTYENFCVTGQQLDARLEVLGATRLVPCQQCDVDFSEPAGRWSQAVLAKLPVKQPQVITGSATARPTEASYNKQNPLTVEVLDNIKLSAAERPSAIHHLELSLDDPNFVVEPGDAIGVLPDNPPALIAAILDSCHLSGEAAVSVNEQSLPLVQALRQHLDLVIPSVNFLSFWAELSQDDALQAIAAKPSRDQRQYLKQIQIRDLLAQAPATPDPQALVDVLRPLQPRLYDVANDLTLTKDELHLSVKAFRYRFGERYETGIASDYLLDRQPGDNIRIYPHRNQRFHLPEQTGTPVILIGESTGIAPYLSFIQSFHKNTKVRPCWLVFAEQQFEEDFLYQIELQQALQKGLVEHIDTVFYQDQPGASLATPLTQHKERFRAWLDKGAHVYLCGDKPRLSDCGSTLGSLIGSEYWEQLGKEKRIHRNLY